MRTRTIAIANQKGGTGKSTTAASLGIALSMRGKRVLLVDADPQGDLTTSLGWDPDRLETTLSTHLEKSMLDEPFPPLEGVLRHKEGVDLMPANIDLSAADMALVNAMSREHALKTWLDEAKRGYDYVLIDCPPSLGMMTVNALTAARGAHTRAGAVPACKRNDAAHKDHRTRQAPHQPRPCHRRRSHHSR